MTITPFLPMLAVRSKPFDSEEYLFEVKWDGIRALAGRDGSGWRLWGRDQADYRPRYPELEFLNRLPPGPSPKGLRSSCAEQAAWNSACSSAHLPGIHCS